ncbi:MAG: AarF/ABC1/UbiB kinase family protein [Nitrospirae bacterium]|nr:AarF/ABC1/UbiB kinase family protein [Nitrospirota bacterium]
MQPGRLQLLLRVGRLARVLASVLARFAWRSVAHLARRPWVGSSEYADETWRLRGWALRTLCQEMGATFIKLGQILSTRRDLMPPSALSELEKLQDDIPGVDGSLVRSIFQADFGKPVEAVFRTFEHQADASASVAQVHHGILGDGTEVAVKFVKPGVHELMEMDTRLLVVFAGILSRIPFRSFPSLPGLAETFCEMLRKQTDLTIEAENNRRFQTQFREDREIIRFPRLVDEFCSRNVLTMEYIRGVKPTRLTNGGHDRKKLALNLLLLYYKMLMHGYVHADMHPGNIWVSAEGFYWVFDLGLVAQMDWEKRRAFFETWASLFMGDGRPLAHLITQMSLSHDVRDMAALEGDTTAFLRKRKLDRIVELDFGAIIMEFGDIQRKYAMVASPELSGIGVSLFALEGLARYLDPDLNIGKSLAPHLKKLLRRLYLMDPNRKPPLLQLHHTREPAGLEAT